MMTYYFQHLAIMASETPMWVVLDFKQRPGQVDEVQLREWSQHLASRVQGMENKR